MKSEQTKLTRADVAIRFSEVKTLAGWRDTAEWATGEVTKYLEAKGKLWGFIRERDGQMEYVEGPHVRIDTQDAVFSLWPLRNREEL